MEKQIHIGTAYYPEHWSEERWDEDIRLIKESGMTALRIAENAWAEMEPADNKFDFSWLDRFIEKAAAAGLKLVICTPSENSPVWMRRKVYMLGIDNRGLRVGGRGIHCHNNNDFIFYSNRITEKMAERYGKHPAVIGWQVDNELRGVECYCDDCRKKFREWLQDKYKTIDELNKAWGNTLWSKTCHSWDEVWVPSYDELTLSTSQIVDFKRFISHTSIKFLHGQAEIIRKFSPGRFVSHNCLGMYTAINQYQLNEKFEVAAWDCYPDVDADYTALNIGHDLARGSKGGQNFWILEQKNGYLNYSDYNLALVPGIVRTWTYHDIARGANGVLFYRWRSGPWCYEQNPNGILKHDGTPRRAYGEIKQVCSELAPVSQSLAATQVLAEAAIIHSYDDLWASEAYRQYKNFNPQKIEEEFYRSVLQLGVTADLVSPAADLSKYKVVIAPVLRLVSAKVAENIKNYVANGGVFITGLQSAIKDENNIVVDTTWPGRFRELCGVTVDEFEAFPDHSCNSVTYRGKSYETRWWADILTTETAQSEAVYNDKFYKGKAAVAVNAYGKGKAVYFGVAGCQTLIKDFLRDIFKTVNVTTTEMPDNVYLTVREGGGKRFAFVINMAHEPRKVQLNFDGRDVLTGRNCGKEITLQPLEVVIIS